MWIVEQQILNCTTYQIPIEDLHVLTLHKSINARSDVLKDHPVVGPPNLGLPDSPNGGEEKKTKDS